MRQILVFSIFVLLLSGCATTARPDFSASVAVREAVNAEDSSGYARALSPREFRFPADHGPHPEFQIEWWYYTGNLQSAEGRHFGYQFTIFRRALSPQAPQRDSTWATRNIYMAHLALSDVQSGQFYAFERFSRDGAGLAGASGEPFRVFLEDWEASSSDPQVASMRIRAAEGPIALDLDLISQKPPVLQGDRGLSQKGREPGNASYYYSLTRMTTSGTVQIADERFAVSGLSWMDREWSTSSLDAGVIGWDWFSLHLNDNSELMFYQLRQADGGIAAYTAGTYIAADGSSQQLSREMVQLTPQGEWRSPRSGARYPSAWRLQVPSLGLDLQLTPYLADQELPVTVVYWEGAVRVSGSRDGNALAGDGYVELTGYSE